jgi:hypothetical protein
MVGETSSLSAREPTAGATPFSRSFVPPLIAFVVLTALLLGLSRNDYPELHTMLDTGMFLMSVVLTSLLWEIGRRLDRGFPIWMAGAFGITAVF